MRKDSQEALDKWLENRLIASTWRYRIIGGLVATVLLAIFFWLINQ